MILRDLLIANRVLVPGDAPAAITPRIVSHDRGPVLELDSVARLAAKLRLDGMSESAIRTRCRAIETSQEDHVL